MRRDPSRLWRGLFVSGGLLYFAGSFSHPRGMTMAEMLVNPAWIPAHAAVFVGFLMLVAGLVAYRRAVSVPPAMDRWLRATLVLAVFQVIEMGLHTMAYVDADAVSGTAFHGGMSTPVLTTHLWLSTLAFTPFAAALIGLIGVGQRERLLGSPWIGWLGMIAAVAYGSVMWLVFIIEVDWAGVLFPIAHLGVSLWFVLAGVWPIRQDAARAEDAAVAGVVGARS
ncbi:MAG: hypothetical protein R2834_24375 [Rhodothermales bacterium]